MKDLSPSARTMIDEARRSLRPTDGDRRRIADALARSAATGAGPRLPQLVDAGEPADSAETPSRRRTVVVMTAVAVVLGLAAMAMMWWGPMGLRVWAASASPEDAAAYESRSPAPEGSAVEREPPPTRSPATPQVEPALVEAEVPEVPEVPEAEVPTEVLPEEPAEVATTGSARARAGRPSRPAAGGLAAELALLERARAAMSSGRHGEVVRLVKRYRAAHPKGSFSEEAAALRVLALCESKRQGAQKAALAFAKRYPASLTMPRIRASCDL
ncbi:MAG: hypothetical protein K0V04_21035 [Deltaproteobacteria bacterium]|nr:hypothetical protein [Deltaproteobacteria bacterium]